MFILKKGHQPGVYVPLRALFLVKNACSQVNDRCPLGYLFAYAKTKMQISFAVTAKLISTFVFATWIVQFLFYLNQKFQASSHLLGLYSLV